MTIQIRNHPMFFSAAAVNAAFSVACGLLMAIAPGAVAEWLGSDDRLIVRVLGIGLALFALRLAQIRIRGELELSEAWSIVGGDMAWVVFSATLLLGFGQRFSSMGQGLIAMTGLVVMALALWQSLALIRVRQQATG